jgi:hypothetical protein
MAELFKEFMSLVREYGLLEFIGGTVMCGLGYIFWRVFKYGAVKGPEAVDSHLKLVTTLDTNSVATTSAIAATAAAITASNEGHKTTHAAQAVNSQTDMQAHKQTQAMIEQGFLMVKEGIHRLEGQRDKEDG